jgi:hypothetical protein
MKNLIKSSLTLLLFASLVFLSTSCNKTADPTPSTARVATPTPTNDDTYFYLKYYIEGDSSVQYYSSLTMYPETFCNGLFPSSINKQSSISKSLGYSEEFYINLPKDTLILKNLNSQSLKAVSNRCSYFTSKGYSTFKITNNSISKKYIIDDSKTNENIIESVQYLERGSDYTNYILKGSMNITLKNLNNASDLKNVTIKYKINILYYI